MCLCISRAKVYLVIYKNAYHGCVYSCMLLVGLFIITIWGLDVLFVYFSLTVPMSLVVDGAHSQNAKIKYFGIFFLSRLMISSCISSDNTLV
jgi:hypothetical protein